MENVGKSVRMILTVKELEKLENIASSEKRSLSNTVSIIVSEYLENLETEKEKENTESE
jgi:hypothetical protein